MKTRPFATALLGCCILISLACQKSKKSHAAREQSAKANIDTPLPVTGSNADPFVNGVNYGLVMQHEGEFAHAFVLLRILEGEDTDRVRDVNRLLKLRLNGALLGLHALRDLVKMKHPLISYTNHIKAKNFRTLMQKLKIERSAKGWTSDDPEIEKKISDVIEIYCRDGVLIRGDTADVVQ